MRKISTQTLGFYIFLLRHRAVAKGLQTVSSPPEQQRNPALITDLINEAIDECKYQISYANDHNTQKKFKKKKVYYPHQEFLRVQKLRMGKEHFRFNIEKRILYKSEAKDNQNIGIWHCRCCCPFQGSITKVISIHGEEKMIACTGILCSSCDTSANIKNGENCRQNK